MSLKGWFKARYALIKTDRAAAINKVLDIVSNILSQKMVSTVNEILEKTDEQDALREYYNTHNELEIGRVDYSYSLKKDNERQSLCSGLGECLHYETKRL